MNVIEARDILSQQPTRNDFAESLLTQLDRQGFLSPKQEWWLKKLATDAATPSVKPETISLANIFQLFEHAKEHGAKRVRILFQKEEVKFSLAGDASREPGTVNVTDGKPYGENKFYGRIRLDGKFYPNERQPMTPETLAFIQRFEADPAGVSAASGKEMGSCVYCSKELTTVESLDAGYGPVCAKKYGLPWG
jgi:hypothetical protein